jgi:hypothetical protein
MMAIGFGIFLFLLMCILLCVIIYKRRTPATFVSYPGETQVYFQQVSYPQDTPAVYHRGAAASVAPAGPVMHSSVPTKEAPTGRSPLISGNGSI